MELAEQILRCHRRVQIHFDQGEEMNDGSQIEDFAGVAFESSQIEKFGNQRLGDVFVFADFLFIDGEHIPVLASRGAGQGHGFQTFRRPAKTAIPGVAPANPESG